MSYLLPGPLLVALREAGIADESTRRVVINIQAGEIPQVYIERYGDKSLLKVVQTLAGIEITREEEG